MMADVFPQGFVFGVATAAYQVEGHIENDWAAWERAGKLYDPSMRCGRGVDHWNRFEADLELATRVNARAFRMSLEWARIEPEPGRYDENALANYRSRLQRMNAVGVRPVVTLHHFTHPGWFHERHPWHVPESVVAFRRFARVCAKVLDGQDAVIVPFNEPMVLTLGGYLRGLIPPGIQDAGLAVKAIANICRAHVAAREEILTACGRHEIGISQNLLVFAPDRPWHPLDRVLSRMAAANYNHAVLEALTSGRLRMSMPGVTSIDTPIEGGKGALDFIGVNYYTRAHLRFSLRYPYIDFRYRDRHERGLTHMGWEDYPEGFGIMLDEVQRYGLPVWITENGIDDRVGDRRSAYLHAHWRQVIDACRRGIDVRGYLYWSLMDNFEWLDGWGPRFGLYRVDFDTLERTATPACDYFRTVAGSGTLTAPLKLA